MLSEAATAASEDVSPSGAAALLTLLHRAPLTTTELARIVGVSQPAGVRLLDGLVAKGLVMRRRSGGREVPLELTPEGRDRASRLQAGRLARLNDALSVLSAEEREAFGSMAARMLAADRRTRAEARHLCRYCAHDICRGAACPVGSTVVNEEETDHDHRA